MPSNVPKKPAKKSKATQDTSSDSLYLNKLKFDPKLYDTFMYQIIKNTRLTFLAIITLFLAGLFALVTLPRELNPEVDISIVNVVTALPGANPLDVEELITDKLEKEIDSIPEIDRLTSSSQEGVSVITAEFNTQIDVDEAVNKVKEKVDLVNDLPEDATTPRVSKIDFNAQPVLQLALVSEVDRRSLSRITENIQDVLERQGSIREVSLAGSQTEEIVISIDATTLRTYQLSPAQIAGALQASDISLPAGSLKVNDISYQVTINNNLTSIEELRQVPIAVGSQQVVLGDIANIYFRAVASDNFTTYSDHEQSDLQAIELSVFKSESATISEAAITAREVIDQELTAYPQVKVVEVIDSASLIDEQFRDLGFNFRDTMFLVFLTLFIFLGLRQASIAAFTIPLAFLATFVIMKIVGITLNFLSLFSLLLALGLVVDDAIVIVQATHRYGQKFSPIESGLLVLRDFIVPIWTTTLTTVWAFLPLLLATGIIGEFIKSIPIVVSAALMSSTTIAVLLNLPLVVMFSKLEIPSRVKMLLAGLGFLISLAVVAVLAGDSPLKPLVIVIWMIFVAVSWWARRELTLAKNSSLQKFRQKLYERWPITQKWFKDLGRRDVINEGVVDFSSVANKYRKFLTKILISKRKRFTVYALVTAFFIVSVLFLVTGLLKNEFFPTADQEQIFVNVEGAAGWPVEKTQQVLDEVEEVVLEAPEIQHIVSKTAASIDVSGFGGGSGGSHLANITVVLPKIEERDRTSMEIAQELREKLADYNLARIQISEVSGGPPVGADLQVNLKGDDLVVLEEVSFDLMAILEEIPGAVNINSSLKQNPGQIKVVLNEAELGERGLSPLQVAGWLRSAVTGNESGDIKVGQNDLDIVIEFDEDELTLSRLQNLLLPTQTGNYTLAEVATLSLETSPTVVSHQDLSRVVVVTAAVQGISTPELLQAFQAKAQEYDFPAGVTWDVGGANEENQESTLSIIQAMGLSVILILLTMVVQLNSFRKSLLVLIVIPLAVAGVFFNFTLLGVPLSFAALIGVLALFGIVVNNSIMLIEKINQNINFGLPFYDAVVDACGSRMEAIFFTSLTTSMGLLPITIADPFWRGLGGAIIAGLSVSGILILFLLPALYVELYQHSDENRD